MNKTLMVNQLGIYTIPSTYDGDGDKVSLFVSLYQA